MVVVIKISNKVSFYDAVKVINIIFYNYLNIKDYIYRLYQLTVKNIDRGQGKLILPVNNNYTLKT